MFAHRKPPRKLITPTRNTPGLKGGKPRVKVGDEWKKAKRRRGWGGDKEERDKEEKEEGEWNEEQEKEE